MAQREAMTITLPYVEDPELEDFIQGIIEDSMGNSERSRWAADHKIGVSDIGHCREYVRRMLMQLPFSDDEPDRMAAFVGTAVGDHVERKMGEGWKTQQTIVVEMDVDTPGGPVRLNLPGHPDAYRRDRVLDLKGLAVDTKIPTPSGWTTMGDLQVGDQVFDRDGDPVRVVGKSGVKQIGCYRITFAGGHQVVCDEEHIWIAREGLHGADRDVKITDLNVGQYVPVAGAIATSPSGDPSADPWLLGFWLGNGHVSSARVSAHGDDLDEISKIATDAGYTGKISLDGRANTGTVSLGSQSRRGGFMERLRELGVLETKRVPESVLRASIPYRTAVLRGLMDSDGSWNKKRKRAVYTSTSPLLIEGVRELVRSLGQRVQANSWTSSGYGKEVEAYGCEWTPTFNPFRLRRKRDKVTMPDPLGSTRHAVHKIEAIERVETVPTVCIMVDSPTSSFLCGEAFIPTHNTTYSLDVKSKYGPSLQQKFQVSLYADALIKSGEVDPDPTLSVVYMDRSARGGSRPVVYSWKFDPTVVEAARSWLGDVFEAMVLGNDAPRDMERHWCMDWCPFATDCRGEDTDVEGLLEDEVAAAARVYMEASKAEREAKVRKDQAKGALAGVSGRTRDGMTVRTVTVPPSFIAEGWRGGYERIYVSPGKSDRAKS